MQSCMSNIRVLAVVCCNTMPTQMPAVILSTTCMQCTETDNPTDNIDNLEIADDPVDFLCAVDFLVSSSRRQTVLIGFSRRTRIQNHSIQRILQKQ